MATFAAKNSVEMKKKPMIILKELIFFVLVSTALATGRRSRIHNEVRQQSSFSTKL